MIRLASRRSFFQVAAKAVVDERLDNSLHFAVAELGLGLSFELRIRKLDADDAYHAFANVVAGKVFLHFLEQVVGDGVVVHRARQGGLESDQMRSAFVRIDVVREGEDLLLIAVVVLKRDLKIDPVADPLKVNDLVVQ